MDKILTGAVVVSLVLGVLGLVRPNTVVVEKNDNVGAFPGPEMFADSFVFNNVENKFFSSTLNQASTTVCSFQTPNATSTLVFASLKLNVGSTTATTWSIGRANVNDATTTPIGTAYAVASDAVATIVASTSPATGDAIVFPPNNHLNFKYGGPLGALNVFTGQCKAHFIVN